jgi:hypothetical protein
MTDKPLKEELKEMPVWRRVLVIAFFIALASFPLYMMAKLILGLFGFGHYLTHTTKHRGDFDLERRYHCETIHDEMRRESCYVMLEEAKQALSRRCLGPGHRKMSACDLFYLTKGEDGRDFWQPYK